LTVSRKQAVILADAVKAVGMPDEVCGEQLRTCMTALRRWHRHLAGMPSPAAMKELSRDRVKVLVKARTVLVAMGSPGGLLDAIDGYISIAAAMRDDLVVPKGSRPVNLTAASAAIMARSVLRQFGVPAKKTGHGAWYRLSTLLYEAATGDHDVDLSKYCREADELPKFRYANYIPKR
jgi:hypothetical protein